MVKLPSVGWRARSRVVMEAQLGRPLRSDEDVHHINGDASDDRLENLEVLPRGEHRRLHHPGPTGRAKTRKRKLPRTIPKDEVQALLEACNMRTPTGLRDRCILEVMLRAGLRIGEVRRLHRRDVDLNEGEIMVYDSKAGDGTAYFKTADLSPLLERWLDVRRRELRARLGRVPREAPLFCSIRPPAGRELSERTIEQMVKRRARKAGVDPSKVTPHRFRHTFATTMLSKRGVTVYDVQQYMRHASLKSTEVYLHVSNPDLREKMQRIDS